MRLIIWRSFSPLDFHQSIKDGGKIVNFIVPFIICFLVFAALFIAVFVLNYKRSLEYINIMYQTQDVIQSLCEVADILPKGSLEYLVINKALNYLRFSIMKDYESAFQIIEKCFISKEVKALHQSILESETSKAMYLLTM